MAHLNCRDSLTVDHSRSDANGTFVTRFPTWTKAVALVGIVAVVLGCGDIASRPEIPPTPPPGNPRVTLENYERVLQYDATTQSVTAVQRSDVREILGEPDSTSKDGMVDRYRGVDGSKMEIVYIEGSTEPFEARFTDAYGFSHVTRNNSSP